MRTRAARRLLIFTAVVATLAVPGTVVAQEGATPGAAQVNELYVQPSTTQAGGHPDVHLFFRFCSALPHVVNATNATPIVITTAEPHGLEASDAVAVRGVRGNIAANQQTQADVVVLDANSFELHAFAPGAAVGAPISGSGNYTGGGWVSKFGSPALHGCTSEQHAMQIRRFLLQLPPGFLGNPEAVQVCRYDKWVSSDNRNTPGEGCPFSSQVGHSNTRTVTIPPAGPMVTAPTGLYRVPTAGLEPARLGTDVLVGDPPGPVAIAVKLRTTGDFGINSAVIDLPKNLGGPQAAIAEIETVLCGYAPCTVPPAPDHPNFEHPVTVTRCDLLPDDPCGGFPVRPFFVNPTSCEPAVANLQAWSWLHPDALAEKRATRLENGDQVPSFTPTGCQNVPFTPQLSVQPTETSQAGAPSAQRVVIQYPEYADDPIWQSALRHADVTLPEGMTLSPGGGNGLEACSFEQFGVNAAGKQVNDDPPTCPDGSQIGTIKVETPVLPDKDPVTGEDTLKGRVFFGPVTAPGRPALPDKPWKLFLYIEGAGLRIKLVGDVEVSPEGQIHNVFINQPQVPFTRLELNLRGGDRSILANPDDCGAHEGFAHLVGWADTIDQGILKRSPSTPTVTTTDCPDPRPFAPTIDTAGSNPEQAGANTTSFITISRGDGQEDIKQIQLSLPSGAVGSLAAVPQCAIQLAQAGNCPIGTKVGTVKTTVGSGSSLLTTSGSLYLAEASQPGDAATLALVVPAKVGPIDLGQVVVLNRVFLRDSDSGVESLTAEIPNIIEGVPLHVRKVEITVDREGFFLNPTGCEPRPLTATFTSYSGQQSSSTMMLNAKGCENLSFAPELRLIAGARGQNAQHQHPPLTAIVTQGAGEANIKHSEVILPDLLRPNSVQFNAPGGLCTDAEFATGTCPGPSLVGSARVITPVLPFVLAGPVYVVQEVGSILPKLYVVLQGEGIRVVLRARNSFLRAVRTINTFENLPDVPQAYFELKIKGGNGGILNNFFNACTVARSHRKFDYTFTAQNGMQQKKVAYLEQEGCAGARTLGAAIASRTLRVSRKGVGKLRIRCRQTRRCRGRITVRGKGVSARKRFSIARTRSKMVNLRFSKKEVRKIRNRKRLRTRAVAKVGRRTARRSITIMPARR